MNSTNASAPDLLLADYWLMRHPAPDATSHAAFQALCVALFAAYEQGDTLIQYHLPPEIQSALQQTGLLGEHAPIIGKNGYYWLNVLYQQERQLSKWLRDKALGGKGWLTTLPPPPHRLTTEQQQAWQHALTHRFTIINGGPGTGKTTTLAEIVISLKQERPDLRFTLAAPTGKAAQRMSESLAQNIARQAHALTLPPAQTLHRLLGISATSGAKYHQNNPLPYDVVVVDEASMLSLELAHALFAALSPQSALILLGDAGQLAAVDAGAVLADMIQSEALQGSIITLTQSMRFNSESVIGQLAKNVGNPSALFAVLQTPHPHLHYQTTPPTLDALIAPFEPYFEGLRAKLAFGELIKRFNQYRVLSSTHHGKQGIQAINQHIAEYHKALYGIAAHQEPFHGQPILITANDYTLGVFNGDIGLCLENKGEYYLYLEERPEPIPMHYLNPNQYQSAYALTVHKSQGSEFERVALVLPDYSEHLSQELLYTGISRAKTHIDIYASQSALQKACDNPTQRQTGLLRFD